VAVDRCDGAPDHYSQPYSGCDYEGPFAYPVVNVAWTPVNVQVYGRQAVPNIWPTLAVECGLAVVATYYWSAALMAFVFFMHLHLVGGPVLGFIRSEVERARIAQQAHATADSGMAGLVSVE
jgi:hypothetical protein